MGRFQLILDGKDIERILIRISHEIVEEHRGAVDLTLIGIHTRGVHLANRIKKKYHRFHL